MYLEVIKRVKKYIISILLFLISLIFIIYDYIHFRNMKMYMVGIPIILTGIGLMIILNNKTHSK